MVRKKGTKNIVQEMNVGLSKREASRIAQNNRRKYQRRLARSIEEQTGNKVNWKEAESEARKLGSSASDDVKRLLNAIEGGKALNGGGYSVDVLKESENIASYTAVKYGWETLAKKGNVTQERKNTLFKNQVNQSTKKDGISILEGEKTKAFYSATSDMWKGEKNSSGYNNKIMEKTGINDFETVYKLLTDEELKPENFGFSKDEKDLFEEWLEDLDKKFHLLERRKIIIDELKSKGLLNNTNDESMSNDTEKQYETSPQEINRIMTRIAEMLNRYE